jgi:hypothetical protein
MFQISINDCALMSMKYGDNSFKSLIDLSTNICSGWGDVFKNENDL